ncbi:MAG: amidohydrolase family protein, partial [Bdellovibrionales bacterium]|nr:amidohydrolase family protein [Bdellovibrionales bacterium]
LQQKTSLTIEGRTIHSVGQNHGEEMDGSGYLVIPGLINSHTHSPMVFLRDRCHGQDNMIDEIFFKTESQLNSDMTENLSYPYLLSGLKSGVTSFVEHYYCIDGIARAFEKVGLRAFLGETLADIGGAFPSTGGLDNFKAPTKSWSYSDRIQPVLCPHATDTVSPDMAQAISEFAREKKLSLHFHLSQRKEELAAIQKKFGKTPVQLADEWGWLGKNSLAVHLLHVGDTDLQILKDSGTCVVSSPSSQILYERLAPIDQFYNRGIPLSLGTDCAASNDQADLLSELKIFTLLMKDRGITNKGLYQEAFTTVTVNPARALNAPIGQILPGFKADLVFVKQALDTLPLEDIWTHLIFSYSSRHVDHVMVDGRFVLFNKDLCLADECELQEQFTKYLREIKF